MPAYAASTVSVASGANPRATYPAATRGNLAVKECEIIVGLISNLTKLQGEARRSGSTVWITAMGFGFQLGNPQLHLLAAIAGLICWWQDARYLAKRRALRARYCRLTEALAANPDEPPISDPLTLAAKESAGDIARAIFSPSLWVLYTALIGTASVIWIKGAFPGIFAR